MEKKRILVATHYDSVTMSYDIEYYAGILKLCLKRTIGAAKIHDITAITAGLGLLNNRL